MPSGFRIVTLVAEHQLERPSTLLYGWLRIVRKVKLPIDLTVQEAILEVLRVSWNLTVPESSSMRHLQGKNRGERPSDLIGIDILMIFLLYSLQLGGFAGTFLS